MRVYDIADMIKGYFVGDFEPSVLKTNDVEIAVKRLPSGYFELLKVSAECITIVYILTGKIVVSGMSYGRGQILRFEKGEHRCFAVNEETEVLWVTYGKNRSAYDFDVSLEKIINDSQNVLIEENLSTDIRDEEISFLIQGAVIPKYTEMCISSIRMLFPKSRVILSTWKDSEVPHVNCDDYIFNEDPGILSYVSSRDGEVINHNLNRQLLSVKEGLKMIKTRFTMKIRSDEILTSKLFLNYFQTFSKSQDEYRIFKHKIIVPEIFSMHKHKTSWGNKEYPLLFSPSDWFYFGYTDDLKTLFEETPLISQKRFSGNFHKNPERTKTGNGNLRFHAEQYIAISALEKKMGYVMEDYTDWDEDKINYSNHWMMSNFIILDYRRHGVLLPKYIDTYNFRVKDEVDQFFTFDLYKRIYESGIDVDESYFQPEFLIK